jgi:hypothetical protein
MDMKSTNIILWKGNWNDDSKYSVDSNSKYQYGLCVRTGITVVLQYLIIGIFLGEPNGSHNKQGRGRERGPESVPRPTAPWTYVRLDFGQVQYAAF